MVTCVLLYRLSGGTIRFGGLFLLGMMTLPYRDFSMS
jgi:hypothetical protein